MQVEKVMSLDLITHMFNIIICAMKAELVYVDCGKKSVRVGDLQLRR